MSPDVLYRTAGPASGASTHTELAETEQIVRHLSARRRRHAVLVVVGLAVALVTVMAVRVLLGRYTRRPGVRRVRRAVPTRPRQSPGQS